MRKSVGGPAAAIEPLPPVCDLLAGDAAAKVLAGPVFLINVSTMSHEFAKRIGVARPLHINACGLTESLSMSPAWEGISSGVLVTREDPRPVVAIVGEFGVEDLMRVAVLRHHLRNMLLNLRYVGYEQAERDVEALARRLVAEQGEERIRRACFTAVPRGGQIVLGMLAYALSLDRAQLSGEPTNGPLVVVDDCAVSGARFRQFLGTVERGDVIFAHLYSHPGVRLRLVEHEPAVTAAIAAHDLVDRAPELLGARYEQWRGSYELRFGAALLPIVPDPLCFAWSEPSLAVWNPVTRRVEGGWRAAPPELCLSYRGIRQGRGRRVQYACPKRVGELMLGRDILFADRGRDVIVFGTTSGADCYRLTEFAADIWRSVMSSGRARAASTPVEKSRAEAVIAELLGRGLLEESGSDPDPQVVLA